MESVTMTSPDLHLAQQAAGEVSAPVLNYDHPRRFALASNQWIHAFKLLR